MTTLDAASDPPFPNHSMWLGGGDEESQVSTLLCIGLYLNGRYDEATNEVAESLNVPPVRVSGPTARNRSLPRLTALSLDRDEPAPSPQSVGSFTEQERAAIPALTQARVARLWANMRDRKSARSAVAFLYLNLNNESRLVRSAAAAILTAVRESDNRVVADTRRVFTEDAGYTGEFARHANDFAAEGPTSAPADTASETDESLDSNTLTESAWPEQEDPTSAVIHGTFASMGNLQRKWFYPTAKLPELIRTSCTPSLYANTDDFFYWSGGYSSSHRTIAAKELVAWCADRGVTELDTVFAHSHGGNVVLQAIAEEGLRVRLLVLLHTPVLPRSDWNEVLTRIRRIADLRTPFDWVVVLDRISNGSTNGVPQAVQRISTDLSMPVTGSNRISHVYYRTVLTWRNEAIAPKIEQQRARA